MTVFKHTATKSTKGIVFAFGRCESKDGLTSRHGGYKVYKLCENYNGSVRGGIEKTWRVAADGMSYEEAVKYMNKRLGKVVFDTSAAD